MNQGCGPELLVASICRARMLHGGYVERQVCWEHIGEVDAPDECREGEDAGVEE